ncbi:MAG: zinc ribbon domain-containing protein [Caldilineaceae bacterium]
MPIYEFSCTSCGAEFEMKRSFSDSSMPVCPNCQSSHVQRLLSRPAIHFKGSGWYITDSKNSSKEGANGKAAPSEGSSAETKSSETKSEEAKPAESKPSETKSEDNKSKASSAPSKSEASAS